MAVDYGSEIVPVGQEQQSPGILARMESHPYISVAVAIGVAIVIGYVFSKIRGSSTPGAATNQPGTSEGLPTTDANGNPVYYVPTSNTFLDYNNVAGSYNTTTTNNEDVDDKGTPHPPPPVPAPKPTSGPFYKGKSPFPYKFGASNFNWIGPDKRPWSVGFGPDGRVWGVPGKNISKSEWANTPIPPKTLLYQD